MSVYRTIGPILVYVKVSVEFAKNKCLGTIWSTKKIPVAWTYPAREHYKNANFL